jgi:hypothetical protein
VYLPRFELRAFDRLPREAQKAIVYALLEALILANRYALASLTPTPFLYASGIRYERKPGSRENWEDVEQALYLRRGACADLASWRVAELRNAGEETAKPLIRVYQTPREIDFHVLVQRADGTVEDPSRDLGMP